MVKRKSIRRISEELAELDEVSDTVWEIRGVVCKILKKNDYIEKEESCSEYQGSIDAIIRRLIDQV